jgi:hypothetical protein
MDHLAGLDASAKEISVCIVDDTGKIVREVVGGAEEPSLPIQANWGGSRAASQRLFYRCRRTPK